MVRMVAKRESLNPLMLKPPTVNARIVVNRAATAAASVGVAMPA